MPPKFLKHIVILFFQRRCPKQNSVICIKSSIFAPAIFLAPPKFLDWLLYCIDVKLIQMFKRYVFAKPCVTYMVTVGSFVIVALQLVIAISSLLNFLLRYFSCKKLNHALVSLMCFV